MRVRNGRLHRIHRGVYAVGHTDLSIESRYLAAIKACGAGAFLSHFAGGALYECVEWDGRRIEVTVRGRGTRLHSGLRVHRAGHVAPGDVTRYRGIPVTSPARTLLDLATVLGPAALRRAVRRAQALRLVNVRQVTEMLARHRGHRGAGRLAEALATGSAPTRSELEDVLLDLMLTGGIAHPDVNVPLVVNGHRVIPDFRWPEQRLVVEADGAAWHEHSIARMEDAARQALLEAHGERVVRVTWDQAVRHPDQTLARLFAAGAPRACRASS